MTLRPHRTGFTLDLSHRSICSCALGRRCDPVCPRVPGGLRPLAPTPATRAAAHAHVALLGWVSITICAIPYRVVAAFLLPETPLPQSARWQILSLAALIPVLRLPDLDPLPLRRRTAVHRRSPIPHLPVETSDLTGPAALRSQRSGTLEPRFSGLSRRPCKACSEEMRDREVGPTGKPRHSQRSENRRQKREQWAARRAVTPLKPLGQSVPSPSQVVGRGRRSGPDSGARRR